MGEQAMVVVGVDGSGSALAAVREAVREAAWRGCGLRIVHAFIWPLMHVDVGASEAVPEGGLRHDAERILAEATAAAKAANGRVEVTADLVTGGPAGVLLAAARGAQLLVLGDRGLGGFTGLLLGSVAVEVTAHCATPVLVVRGAGRPGPVVLGVDGSPGSASAVRQAFLEARQRDAELLAVRVWHDAATTLSYSVPALYDADAARAAEQHELDAALDGEQKRCPDVRVRTQLVSGRTGRELVRLSEQAQLMVVGARGRGGFTGLLLGSVSQQLLHHAACPVLMVRHEPAGEPAAG
ncbi:universal stress protein [Catellatospora vulcania]|uniref:universal stress protein n=1 Tax=Catellatospora vulcania TaxID=1460450 RepID=UPI001E2956F1|nr:universal stress protein [Catellatospora vulcania]